MKIIMRSVLKMKMIMVIMISSKNIYNLCGRTQLVDTIDLLASADAVVSNDSGLMHVAAAVGVKVNVIYGSSTPDYTPPLTVDEKKSVFYLALECSPCFKRTCPIGTTACLYGIEYSDVMKSVCDDYYECDVVEPGG